MEKEFAGWPDEGLPTSGSTGHCEWQDEVDQASLPSDRFVIRHPVIPSDWGAIRPKDPELQGLWDEVFGSSAPD